MKRGRKTVKILRQAVSSCDRVVLATDPDREGEAIAWHVVQACTKELRGKTVQRVCFHAIIPAAVRTALAQPVTLDMALVDAQQARRVVDRLVGYQVSPMLWHGIAGPPGLSAGRVQSVALRLIIERDWEIEHFVPQEYWTLDADLLTAQNAAFRARLFQIEGKKPSLPDQASVQAVITALTGATWKVQRVARVEKPRRPQPPYITSTLQRHACAGRRKKPCKLPSSFMKG